jgi:hypothetical protein
VFGFIFGLFSIAVLTNSALGAETESTASASPGHLKNTFGALPLYFIENQGQTYDDVFYYVKGEDKTLYFTSQWITFDMRGDEEGNNKRYIIKLDFIDSNPLVIPQGEDKREAIFSYFSGKRSDWKTGVPTYSKLTYPDLWPGIDLIYHGTMNEIKYEFIVKPGADPEQIRLAYRGPEDVKVNDSGELIVETPAGGFKDALPIAYQEVNGSRVEVPITYHLNSNYQEGIFNYGFELGDYDSGKTLILDPSMFIYCGYIGGSSHDVPGGIAVDNDGNVYVTGWTFSSENDSIPFPVLVGPDTTFNDSISSNDAFVAKVNAEGTDLVYCGYIGGNYYDRGTSIAVDDNGNAYVTGHTGSDENDNFPVTVGPDTTYNGPEGNAWNGEVFVAKVSPDGTDLVYCGYIGGSLLEHGNDITVDNQGYAYVTGQTSSPDSTFPVAVGPDTSFSGGPHGDAFVAKVDSDGTSLVYCGYIGGKDSDSGMGIALDSDNNVYVGGYTLSDEASDSFPVAVGPDTTYNGGEDHYGDIFVAKVNSQGTDLDYCGYIGGSKIEGNAGYGGLAVDDSGNAYITGFTNSDDFPVVVGPSGEYKGGSTHEYDSFVAKVNSDGTGLVYSGYIGGTDDDWAIDIALDWMGNAFVVGATESDEDEEFPVFLRPDTTYNGPDDSTSTINGDAFVAMVAEDGSYLHYCGYIGGTDHDYGHGIAVDNEGYVYVIGGTSSDVSEDFPVAIGPDTTYNGDPDSTWSGDVFVSKIPACGVPELVYPVDGALIWDDRPTFEWIQTFEADSFEVVVVDDEQQEIWRQTVEATQTYIDYSGPTLPTRRQTYWTCRAFMESQWGGFASLYSFQCMISKYRHTPQVVP